MSCKDVCVTMDYDGGNSFESEEVRRARKQYKCVECRETIAIGDKYHYEVGLNDGHFFTNRTCEPCYEIRSAFCCGAWIFGDLWQEIDEQLFPYWDAMKAIDCLAKLTTDKAIAKMRAAYADFKENHPGFPPLGEHA